MAIGKIPLPGNGKRGSRKKKANTACDQATAHTDTSDTTAPKGMADRFRHHCIDLSYHIEQKTGISAEARDRFLLARAMDIAGNIGAGTDRMLLIHGGGQMNAESIADAMAHAKHPGVSKKKKLVKCVTALGTIVSSVPGPGGSPIFAVTAMVVGVIGDALDIAVDRMEEKQSGITES